MGRWGYSVVPPEGALILDVPADCTTVPAPVYRTPDGRFEPVDREWIHPRTFYSSDGSMFVEWPMPESPGGWGLTFHTRYRRTWVGEFVAQYAEGRASGFPWWPVVVFAARVALRRRL